MPTALSRDIDRFALGVVYYNGFTFPPAIRSSCEYEPVYDDANRVVKYFKCKLKIETYLF